ncbi:MAG: chorismate mutase [Anaerolineae bacterium]
MACRGIRGATTVEANTAHSIIEATKELLLSIVEQNGVKPSQLSSAIFTVTPDLNAAFPARAARELGWQYVPLLDAQEMPVPDSLAHCVRVLLHWNTETAQDKIRHVYLRGAAVLRPDLATEGDAR